MDGHTLFDVGLGEGDVDVGVIVASGCNGYLDEPFVERQTLECVGDRAPFEPHARETVEQLFVLGEYGGKVFLGVQHVPGHEIALLLELFHVKDLLSHPSAPSLGQRKRTLG